MGGFLPLAADRWGPGPSPTAPDGNLEKCRSLLDVKIDSVVRTYTVLQCSVGISNIKIPIRVLTIYVVQ